MRHLTAPQHQRKTQELSPGAARPRDPVRKMPHKAELHPQQAPASEAQGKLRKQQPAGEAPPTKRRKTSKKAREPASEKPAGSKADGSKTDSMPGIPRPCAADSTWKQLDKRKDVKRGRFSDGERETLLQAIKVVF